jgi:uncharacterized membrane protein YhhN
MSESSPRRSPSPATLTLLLAAAATVAILTAMGGTAWQSLHYVAKPLATLTVLLLARTVGHPVSARYRDLIGGALAFSLVGDVALMLPGNHFVEGLAAFLVAHLLFLAAFRREARRLPRVDTLIGYAAVAAALVGAIYPSLPSALRAPVLAYVTVISLMAAQSATWMLDRPSPSSRRAAIGAAWFVVSDASLAMDRFRTDLPLRDLVVLGTYFVAQWFLARSVDASSDNPTQ